MGVLVAGGTGALGEAILRELGYAKAEVERLFEQEVVKGPAQWAKR
jgi:hypothetical protein